MTDLECRSLDVRIGSTQVVSNFDLLIQPGQLWGLLGANGIGKTTLLRCLAGLHRPQSGEVLLDSHIMETLPRRMVARQLGMLQQQTAYVFDASVIQTAVTGRHPHLGYWQRETRTDFHKATEALSTVDLEAFAERSVTALSGGEARRLAVATLLVQEPDIMLLDEPTNHLDLNHQVKIMATLRDLTCTRGRSAVAALHDINLAAHYCTHVVMLFGTGQWGTGAGEEMLNETNLQRLYGCAVEKSVGSGGSWFHPRYGHSGGPPW